MSGMTAQGINKAAVHEVIRSFRSCRQGYLAHSDVQPARVLGIRPVVRPEHPGRLGLGDPCCLAGFLFFAHAETNHSFCQLYRSGSESGRLVNFPTA